MIVASMSETFPSAPHFVASAGVVETNEILATSQKTGDFLASGTN